MSWKECRLATRSSRLALVQAQEAMQIIGGFLPSLDFSVIPCSSPGDRDKETDLRISGPDFFTRDLHEAVLNGSADGAVHSAKDVEDHLPAGLDWFWLPDPADCRDVLVLRQGERLDAVKKEGIVGVSSPRREEYCRRLYPGMRPQSIRGTIEERLAQLDGGQYDMLVMAGAALNRLNLQNRISAWIPLDDLEPPSGQGSLALTFKGDDRRFLRLRSLFVKSVVFAGAGSGSAELCTLGAADALSQCDVCFHDSLLDKDLLHKLPVHANRVDIGKRCGDHSMPQAEINALIATAARQGLRVVRLKGGDPGIFGRLAEEIDALDALHLPYRVIPGVSSLAAATTGTGMLLTRRGVSRGFTAMTPRREEGAVGSVRRDSRSSLPVVFFMGMDVLDDITRQLVADGLPETTPVAIVLNAGAYDETVVRGTLADIVSKRPESDRPGIIIAGSSAETGYHREWGALQGRRVLLPVSEAMQVKAIRVVREFGGTPVPLCLFRYTPDPECLPMMMEIGRFDWLIVTSPTAARILLDVLSNVGIDVRTLPRLMVAGPGTHEIFRQRGIVPNAMPQSSFGTDGILCEAKKVIDPHARVLRVRSQRAGPGLTEALSQAGFQAEDRVLYRSEPLRPGRVPDHDAVVFASASAVDELAELLPGELLAGKTIVALGRPTLTALEKHGICDATVAPEATVASAIQTLAAVMVGKELETMA